jgi:hypothetical protein
MVNLRSGISLLLLCCSCAGRSEPASPATVPLRSLRLYETGVGYFERTGTTAGASSLPVPTSHLDDALKSLVILGEGAQVQGVSFPSSLSKPMARAMVGVQAGETLAFPSLLAALKGVHVAVEMKKKGEPLRGRLVELTEETVEIPEVTPKEGEKAPSKEVPRKDHALVLLTEEGALERVNLRDVRSVRPLDPAFASRLSAGLDATSARGTQVQRALRLLGDGNSPVTFGYIAETPVWRASYRIVLEAKSSMLQGWALLHNDTDEDWKNIKLSLVNGRPDSFLFPLAAPRYLRRELLRPNQQLPTTPQLLGQSSDDLWSEGEGESFGAGGLGLSGIGEGGGGRGEGIGLGSVGTIGHGAGTGESPLLSVGNLASAAQATGSEQGALFSYELQRPLSLPRHSSALVPFLEQRVAIEPITWVEDGARIGVRFENSTGQTLPAGTMAVFRDGGFAGETTLDRLKPGERRFLTFGADLDVELDDHRQAFKDETARVVAQGSNLEEHFLRTTDHTITIQNRSPLPRSVYLVLRLHKNAKVTGADAMDYDTAQNKPVAIFRLEPRQKLERAFVSVEGLSRSTPAERNSPEELTRLAESPKLSAEEKTSLRALAVRRTEQEEASRALAASTAETAEIQQEIERLRKNLEALGGDRTQRPEQNPFVRRLLAAEDRLTEARKKQETLQKQASSRKDGVLLALKKLEPSGK